jgi:hypothetical protein
MPLYGIFKAQSFTFWGDCSQQELKEGYEKKKNFVRDRKIQIARSKNENLKS